ncbi:nucleoside/nucleotide kinase family protein [Martelella lutilitoris]|uniref:Nucleoside/nucleotide kinase family protein n=1 Tax=Martelella lutilitoris TaxID=2583532 RepID=A0A5C4JVU0_9HYPH|nr:nucleoside/nucleotide kinase family protein [Martelella lutilitoris]TNB49573.1 nucleoside/nucleotide kinase family protein [Martelella lutilitoris]
MNATTQKEHRFDRVFDAIHEAAEGKDRLIVAIAGAPGSGKSTLSDRLCQRLNAGAADGDLAAVVPMDGFHLDDGVLREQGTLARKGAPFTFDVGGLNSILSRLKANREDAVAVPLFDRDLEIARAGARIIPKSRKIILVEGNYLLLDLPPWSGLKRYFDLSVALSVPFSTLETRLIARWTEQGFSQGEARRRARENDLVNAGLVQEKGLDATLVIEAEEA